MTRERRRDRFGDNRWLSEWVENPTISVGIAELLPLWNETEIRLTCAIPAGFIPGPWMTRSFRGAIGRTLGQWHKTARPHGLAASAYEGLFQTHGTINGDHIPKPVSFMVEVCGNNLVVEMRLFGRAAIWRDDVIEAAIVTLNQGIGLWENGRTLRPWPINDFWWKESTGQIPPMPAGEVTVSWRTPFKPGGGTVFAGDLRSAIHALPRRIKGLARWTGIDLLFDHDQWLSDVERLTIKDSEHSASLDGFIRRGADQDLAVVGVLGSHQVNPVMGDLVAMLWLGKTIGAGGHRAYGFGRYRLS